MAPGSGRAAGRAYDAGVARTLVINGSVISASGTSPADVLVDGGRVAALLAPGEADRLRRPPPTG